MIKQLAANAWAKFVAPAGNTAYVQRPMTGSAIYRYGSATPDAADNTGLSMPALLTINAGLTVWIRPAENMQVFAEDTAGADIATASKGPVRLSTNLPATQAAAVGDDVSFAVVAADGLTPYKYKWFYNSGVGSDVQIDAAINPTAATATLVNSAVTLQSSGVYRCLVEDAAGKRIMSVSCLLTVS